MTQEIIDCVIQYINQEDNSDTAFNEQALRLFRYQYKHNHPYQMFCRQKGRTPRLVKSWEDIPAVPINGFKELTLSCDDPESAEDVFMTSGTTQGMKGKHYHPTLEVYNHSMLVNFKERFMNGTERMKMGILFPTEAEMPNSSLAHYLALAMKECGTSNSSYFVNEDGLQVEQLIKELEQAEKNGEPFALLGASFSFIHLFEELERSGISFQLPEGSKVLDTGGFKNKSKELDLETFYNQLSERLGVDRSNCMNMYGVTELSTQFYDAGNEVVPSVKSGPFWIRTRVIDPLTGKEVAEGKRGVLVHCDLANFNSVTTILTEDVGEKREDGFLLLGRVQGAEAKGCSIAVDELLQATKGTSQ